MLEVGTGVVLPEAAAIGGTGRLGDDAATISVLIAPQATVLGTGASSPDAGAV